MQSLKMEVKSTCKIHLILIKVVFCETIWPENMGLSDTSQNTRGFMRIRTTKPGDLRNLLLFFKKSIA
jgi:hypothetical protein